MMNAVLFGRIAALHDKRAELKLTPEQQRLLERTYTRFHRSGAGLDAAAKARMAEINESLAQLGTGFSHHLLGDEQDWFDGARRGRYRRPAGELRHRRQGCGGRTRPARQGGGDAVALVGRAVPEDVEPPRPAREGVSRLHRPRRQRQCQRQQRADRRDPRRCARRAPGCSAIRPSPPTGSRIRWPRRPRRCAACSSGCGSRRAPVRWPTATRCRSWSPRRAAISSWRRGTGATTPRSCGSAAPISTTPRSSRISRSTT